MSLDTDLQDLRRRAEAEPSDAAARIALALALLRNGAREEARDAFFAARALGAESSVCREKLQELEAPASPWTHVTGDAARTFCAPVRGPRRGVVVAREATGRSHMPNVVVDEDGTLLVGTVGSLVRLGTDLRELESGTPTPASVGAVCPSVDAEGIVLAAGQGVRTVLGRVRRGRHDLKELEIAAPFQGDGAAALGSFVVVGTYDVRRAEGPALVVHLLGPELEARSSFEVPGYQWGVWAATKDAFAVVVDEGVASFALDGTPRFRRPASRVTDGLAIGADGRVVFSELHQSDRTNRTRWVQALDGRDGRYLWGVNLERQSAPGAIALSLDGTVHVVSGGLLVRFSGAGEKTFVRDLGTVGGGGLVVDREGCAFCVTRDSGGREGLAAFDLAGREVWRVSEALKPVAIDALGRVVAVDQRLGLVAVE